jgi:uncharacterized alpha-E superfamily protein
MLSRTADHLFWMARYMERAENTARMLDVNYQTGLLPQSAEAAEQGWRGLLSISELTHDYVQCYGAVTPRSVIEYMVRDQRNLSSIASCLHATRENARAVRGALTTEVWETVNQSWIEFRRLTASDQFLADPGPLLEWVKFRSHLSRGVTLGTMLQDDAFHFLRLGTFLERADNTARLLDVKLRMSGHDILGEANGAGGQARSRGGSAAGAQPPSQFQAQSQSQSQSQSEEGASLQAQSQELASQPSPSQGSLSQSALRWQLQSQVSPDQDEQEQDFYYWTSILRSVSGFEVYRKVYRSSIQPAKVAELLILRPDMPRSLAACVNEVVHNLQAVGNEQSVQTQRLAGKLQAELQYGSMEDILALGLHAFLTRFLQRIAELGYGISRDFLVPVPH